MKKALAVSSILILLSIGSFFLVRTYMLPLKYEKIITKYAKEYNVHPLFVASIVKVESDFNEAQKGGLMNLSDKTAARIAKEMGMKYFDRSLITHPETNLKLGIWYLGKVYSTKNHVFTMKHWTSRNGKNIQGGDLDHYMRAVEKHKSYYKLLHGKKLITAQQ
ncbi:transglycosylase SLT domain-containing protein [Bacillus sp. 165]|uniref:transglycosylase SLT domain-containing protein n=1 Tax=Bacillus sp. 165 TaxID=1529117 RepID=UPI001ADA2886|nr:transglycosylase SLT domain-containing protein [Bacillus sp. 165]MBO9128369.1 transglycosylase SLT domain-containing protein [Bacillus sp. 165]